MHTTNTRALATALAATIAAVEGVTAVRQVVTHGWALDAVGVVLVAVGVINLGPAYLRAAYAARDWLVVGLLGTACVSAGLLVGALTYQRVHAQTDLPRGVVDRHNHAILLARERLADTRASEQRARTAIESAQAQLVDATGRVAANSDRPGPLYHAAVAHQVLAREALADAHKSQRATVDAAAELRQELSRLGPAQTYAQGLWVLIVAYAAALLPLPASIGLFLFAAADSTQRHATALNADTQRSLTVGEGEQHGTSARVTGTPPTGGVDGTSVALATPENPTFTGVPPTNPVVPAGVPCGPVLASDGVRVAPRLPPRNSPLYMQFVVDDILREAHRRGYVPTWQECRARYHTASATTTKYRRAAVSRWDQLRRNQSAAPRRHAA